MHYNHFNPTQRQPRCLRPGGTVVRRGFAVVLAVLGVALLRPVGGGAQRYVPTADPEHPRLKYADSLTSLNDRCIVRKAKLNPKMRPVYVNGQPIGFC